MLFVYVCALYRRVMVHTGGSSPVFSPCCPLRRSLTEPIIGQWFPGPVLSLPPQHWNFRYSLCSWLLREFLGPSSVLVPARPAFYQWTHLPTFSFKLFLGVESSSSRYLCHHCPFPKCSHPPSHRLPVPSSP